MIIATWLALSAWPSVALSIVLAFMFGYSLSMLPILRHGVPFRKALLIALAADTASIATAFPVNRWLIARGKGHAVAHEYHQHR
jgi:hypothetical protein